MKTKIRLLKSRYFIEVFIWKSRKELHQKTKDKLVASKKLDYGALYKPESYIIYPKRKVKPKLGEIHLYRGRTGVGLIAHEVLHCVFDYAMKAGKGRKMLDISDNNDDLENLCDIQGEIVRKIGNWLNKIKAW